MRPSTSRRLTPRSWETSFALSRPIEPLPTPLPTVLSHIRARVVKVFVGDSLTRPQRLWRLSFDKLGPVVPLFHHVQCVQHRGRAAPSGPRTASENKRGLQPWWSASSSPNRVF